MRRFVLAVGLLAAVWAVLFMSFAVERIRCVPLFGPECRAAVWRKFGDIILLTWVSDWGTFTAGLLGLAGALVGAYFLYGQIREMREQETERRRRALLAARGVLPLALSQLTQYAISCADLLKVPQRSTGGAWGSTSWPPGTPLRNTPQIPNDAIAILKEVIGLAPAIVTNALVDIVRTTQILASRVEDTHTKFMTGNTMTDYELASRLVDCAELYGQLSAAFPYSRGETEAIPAVGPRDLSAGLSSFGIYGDQQVDDVARKRFP